MKTPEPPRSSKGKGKGGESAPKGKSPMERFRSLAGHVVSVPAETVRKAERAAKLKKKD